MDNLGEKLLELRKAKNLSQEEVAEKLNVTRQTVSKWETNQSTPDFDKIVPLCELFEISTDELLRGKKAELKKEEKSEEGENGTELKADTKDMNKDEIRRKSANEISTSIFIYIVSIAVFIVIVSSTNIDAILLVGLLLIACAYATARIIKGCMSMPKEESKVKKVINEKKEILKSIKCIIWCLITAIYIILSFATMAWYITWVLFIIGAAITEIVKLCFLLKEVENDEK